MLQRCYRPLITALILSCGFHTFAYAQTEATPEVLTFKQTWVANALKLQREMDINMPLTEATFIGTHNSYNSAAYTIRLIRYVDPNQELSLYDQLEMGVRSIELDTHWTLGRHFKRSILLCHGRPTHTGCSAFDREVTEGLTEIRDWLRDNPGEVILIYVERHLDGHEPRLTFAFNEYFGDLIYKPTTIDKNKDKKACVSLPGSITKADVIKAGKQVIIVTKGCDKKYEEEDTYKENWKDYTFAGIGSIPSEKNSFIDDKIDLFTTYPDCGKTNIFYPDVNHTSLWRVFEDRTFFSSIIHKQKPILDNDMKELMRCGMNWPTMDKLSSNDTRLAAAVWSWAPNYPQSDEGKCGVYQKDVGIKNASCEQVQASYACLDQVTHEIKAIAAQGNWAQGEAMCQALAGKTWHFMTPVNGLQMTLLRESLASIEAESVWLRYKADDTGRWVANA